MGKKKDCFGREDYVCMTPSCPYARECIRVVWEKRMDRVLAKGNKGTTAAKPKRSRARMPVEGR